MVQCVGAGSSAAQAASSASAAAGPVVPGQLLRVSVFPVVQRAPRVRLDRQPPEVAEAPVGLGHEVDNPDRESSDPLKAHPDGTEALDDRRPPDEHVVGQSAEGVPTGRAPSLRRHPIRVCAAERASLLGMETLVRLAEADAGEVLTLQRVAYITEAQAHGDLDLPPLRQSLAELSAELADLDVFALGWRDGNGRLVAAVRARLADAAQSRADIGRLTVAPDRQGQRLGTRLLAAVEAELPSGVTQLRLFTGERSAGNLRLYAQLGYTETARQPTAAGYSLVHLSKERTPSHS